MDEVKKGLQVTLPLIRSISSLQVSLQPISGNKSARQDLIYLFTCTKEDCGKQAGSWRALRCQWDSATTPSVAQAQRKEPPKPAAALDTEGWGFGDETSSTQPNSGFDFSDLSAALDAMSAPVPTTKAKAKRTDSASNEAAEPSHSAIKQDDGPVGLPGFYLEILQGSSTVQSKGGNGASAAHESAHVRDLLKEYEAAHGGELNTVVSTQEEVEDTNEGSSSSLSGGDGDGATDPGTWDGEGYEKDEVLVIEGRKGVDRGFLKFMKKLQRVPDQCARVGRGGDILWPGAELPDPGHCSNCGAAREFSVQLMAPAISALEESADWLEAEGLESGAVERPPPSWDWATAAVFCCKDRCQSAKECYVEEEVFLIGED